MITRWLMRGGLLAWEFPQNSLGVLRVGLALARKRVKKFRWERERVMVELSEGAAISLGLFVLWTDRDNPFVPVGKENIDHEYGHSLQSRMLGAFVPARRRHTVDATGRLRCGLSIGNGSPLASLLQRLS